MKYTSITDEAFIALSGMADYASDLLNPTIRLGVTGLSKAGKTVFITSLVHSLINGGKLPLFNAYSSGRIKRAYLQPQPNDEVPRFPYEVNLEALLAGDERRWPKSTSQISQLRLTLEFEPEGYFARNFSSGKINLDIIDYPGEWLLDLPLLDLSYENWSKQTLEAAASDYRREIAKEWLEFTKNLDPNEDENEERARNAAKLFTDYLKAARQETFALSTLPPGRFLLPGDLAGSPLTTFAPLFCPEKAVSGSLHAMMKRRYLAYINKVVKPFFIDHFAKLDRQVVLVDMLAALNAGPYAVRDLRQALGSILTCFRPGRTYLFNALLGKRIDRVLFAATKADHLHHTSHRALENILKYLIEEAIDQTGRTGAEFDVQAISAIRATRQKLIEHEGEELPAIIGTPEDGQRLADEVYYGEKEIALFPGDLPKNPTHAFSDKGNSFDTETSFMRFRPPLVTNELGKHGKIVFPHIRLDKALNFLLGDRI